MPNDTPTIRQKKSSLTMAPVIIVLLIAIALIVSGCGKKATTTTNTAKNTNTAAINTSASNTNTSVTEELPLNLVATLTFAAAPTDWFEEVWYKAASSGGEVTYGTDGVTFTGIQSNSRSGIMTSIEKDVSAYSSLNLHLVITNNQQTLTGTGWNGREAPVAVAISYLDASGAEHQALGEDPAAAGQIFWRGFYALDPTDQSKSTNGVKVTAGQKYTYDFDLMTLSPKPAKIHFVAVEGAGWKPRAGTVHELSLIASNGKPIENVPTGVNAFLDQSVIDALSSDGFSTYTGTTPPSLEGKYLVSAMKVTSDRLEKNWIGRDLDQYYYTFSNQTAAGAITLASASLSAKDAGSGNGGYISGSNGCFTVYVDLIGKQGTCDYDMPTLVSGCLKNNAIENWNYALLMKSHTDNDTCNNEMTKIGNLRVIKQTTPAPKQ